MNTPGRGESLHHHTHSGSEFSDPLHQQAEAEGSVLTGKPQESPALNKSSFGFTLRTFWTLSVCLVGWFLFCFCDMVSLCSLSSPETSSVDQADQELTEIHLPPECWDYKACATTAQPFWTFLFLPLYLILTSGSHFTVVGLSPERLHCVVVRAWPVIGGATYREEYLR